MSQSATKLRFTPAQSRWQGPADGPLARVHELAAGCVDAAPTRDADDRFLSDIGIPRAQAQLGSEAAVWDYPR